MEGAADMVGVTVVEAMQEDLVEADFMPEVLEHIPLDSLVDAASVVDGTEEAVTGEDVAITRTEDTPIPTTLMGIGLRSVILMAGATESGCRIIEGKASRLAHKVLYFYSDKQEAPDRIIKANLRRSKWLVL